jgi:hypothetical protein
LSLNDELDGLAGLHLACDLATLPAVLALPLVEITSDLSAYLLRTAVSASA